MEEHYDQLPTVLSYHQKAPKRIPNFFTFQVQETKFTNQDKNAHGHTDQLSPQQHMKWKVCNQYMHNYEAGCIM
jgi:hypothetical protein